MRLIYLILIVGIGAVFYLSWVPDPNIERVWFVPEWLGRWADQGANDDLRTAIPFVFLGLFAGVILSRKRVPVRLWFLAWLLLSAVAVLAEAGQLVLPKRSFDWGDVGWGALGAFVGLLPVAIVIELRNRLQH